MSKRDLPTHRPDGLPLFSPKGTPVHWIRTSVLKKFANPYDGCWPDIQKPITMEEVDARIAKGDVPYHEQTYEWGPQDVEKPTAKMLAARRKEHIERIAWFVLNGFQEPLSVDVGIPSMGLCPWHIVQDGNHRLAAGIYRASRMGEDPLLPLSVGGEVNHAIKLGLWEDDPFIDQAHRAACDAKD